MLKKINDTSKFLKENNNLSPKIAIILGTGLGGLVNEIKIHKAFPYNEIPNFPVSTVDGHKGQLIFGHLGGKEVIAMQGRFHFYEGYSMQELTFPIRVFKALGVEYLLLSNASGGLNPDYKPGDLMLINDHINLFGINPLIGKNNNELGPRFPDMSKAYDLELRKKALQIASNNNIKLFQGVYVGVTGPTFETPAEYHYVRIIGGDAVGMSTVPEVIVGRHSSLTCFGISVITDSGVPGEIVEISHEEVQNVAAIAEPKMTTIFKKLIGSL